MIDLHEFLVPLVNIGGLLSNIVVIIVSSGRVGFVIGTPLDNFLEHCLVDLFLCELYERG